MSSRRSEPGLAFIFDMDGVIIDSNPAHREAWARFNLQYGLETTEEMHLRMYGRRNDQIVRDYFGDSLSDEEVAARGRAKEALYREMVADRVEEMLVPGLRGFLERYQDAPMAVASNAEPENVDFLLDRSRLRPYFQAVVNGHQVSNPKPHPDVYLLASRLLGVSPSRCIVFEDSPSGTTAGAAAGMRVIGIRTTYVNLPEVVLTVDNFMSGELEKWVQAQFRLAS
jgi:beta-phosphoglucomutase family hydrolase